MTTTTFADFGLQPALARALDDQGFSIATPIQTRAIPILLEGRDLLGLAQTGTGKTAAFALPLLERLSLENVRPAPRKPRALILAPTRELASQIATALKTLGRHTRLKFLVVVGGVGFRKQTEPLDAGVDIVVATPGRLEDLMQNRRIDLRETRHLVLDEADRMLDIGFAPAIRRIVQAMPAVRQSALFSATMPKTVERLAAEILRDPERVEVAPTATTVDKVEQRVYHTDQGGKRALLSNLLGDPDMNRVIVFVRTKHAANRLAEQLDRDIGGAEAIHGNKSHNARQQALERFKRGKARLLVATDIAARGIDVSDVSHVVNFDLPNDAESYVHRIGRTARAGRGGVAISFCAPAERAALRDIEKLTRQRLIVVGDAPAPEAAPDRAQQGKARPGRPANTGGRPRAEQGRRPRRPRERQSAAN